jgi:hypothetical protein
MDEITADIHKAFFIGMDFGASDMTSVTITDTSSTLTLADLQRAVNKSPPLPPLTPMVEVKTRPEPKSEFKSWPYPTGD